MPATPYKSPWLSDTESLVDAYEAAREAAGKAPLAAFAAAESRRQRAQGALMAALARRGGFVVCRGRIYIGDVRTGEITRRPAPAVKGLLDDY